ncbi:MAG: HTTM domain-containing protein [Myxococcota bacterium]
MQGALKLWDELWFSRVDARDLAGMRIAMGLLLLVWHVFFWPDLDLLTTAGPMDLQVLRENWSPYRLELFDGYTTAQLQAVHVVAGLLIVAFTVGAATPVAGWLLVIWLATVWHRSPWTQNGGDRLLRILLFYMALSPCWRAWSVDALVMRKLGRAPPSDAPVMAVRLIQIQMVVMYTYTGIAKLGGHTWLDGSAIYYSWMDVSYSRWPELMDGLVQYAPVRWAGVGLAWATLVFEVGFLPLIAWRRTRIPTLIAGLLLHAGIWGTLSVGIFSWASVWGYLVFLDPGWAERFRQRLVGLRGGSVAALLPVFLLLGGCAPWVWNERYIECDETRSFTAQTWSKPFTFQVGPYVDGDDDDEACEVRATGLFGWNPNVYDGELELYNAGRATVRHTGVALDLDALVTEWGDCDEDERGQCNTGHGGLYELDAITQGPNGLAGVRLWSGTSGRLALGDGGADVYCAECSLRAAIRHEVSVRVEVAGTGEDEAMSLCLDSPGVVEVFVDDPAPPSIDIELLVAPSSFEMVLPDGSGTEVHLSLPAGVGFDFVGFQGPVFGSGGTRLRVENALSVDIGRSNGQCEPVEFAWED